MEDYTDCLQKNTKYSENMEENAKHIENETTL